MTHGPGTPMPLPPKPIDEIGRPVTWCLLVYEPGFTYGGKFIPVNEVWIDHHVSEWRRLTRFGYIVPAISLHRPEVTDGLAMGDVLDVQKVIYQGRWAMAAAIAWSFDGAQEAIAKRRLKYFSPRFDRLDDDGAGGSYESVLLEVSVVPAPHQKHLGATHIIAGENMEITMPEEIIAPAPAAPTAEERLAALESLVSGLAQKLEGLLAAPAPAPAPMAEGEEEEKPEEKKEEEPMLMAEVRKLRAEVATERKARRKAEFDARYPAGAVVELTPELRDTCFALSEKDAASFQKLAAAAKRPAGKTIQPITAASQIQWGVSLGEGTTTTPDVDAESVYRRALIEAKGDAVRALELTEARLAGGTH